MTTCMLKEGLEKKERQAEIKKRFQAKQAEKQLQIEQSNAKALALEAEIEEALIEEANSILASSTTNNYRLGEIFNELVAKWNLKGKELEEKFEEKFGKKISKSQISEFRNIANNLSKENYELFPSYSSAREFVRKFKDDANEEINNWKNEIGKLSVAELKEKLFPKVESKGKGKSKKVKITYSLIIEWIKKQDIEALNKLTAEIENIKKEKNGSIQSA